MNLNSRKDLINLSEKEENILKEAKSKVKADPIATKFALFGLAIFLLSYQFYGPNGSRVFTILGIIIIAISLIVIINLYYQNNKTFKALVKEIVILKVFQSQFDKVVYNPSQGFDESYINDLEMYNSGNNYKSEDLLLGVYKGVGFSQADVSIKQITSNGKTTTTTTYFEGRWIVCDFFKDFSGNHQIRSNSAYYKNRKPNSFFNRSSRKVKFEDEQFNKDFVSYTSDEKEIYYLITPDYMETMSNLQSSLNCEVVFGFINNKLHIAIYNNENAYEISGTSINDEFVDKILYQTNLIKEVIDGLHLDLDIFK